MSAAARQFRAAGTLLAGLRDAGARIVVVSPGARSMPIALAARRVPGLETVAVRDERSAAFLALGAARSTGRPAVLLATSGSAGAHWHPAFVEADAAEIPLVGLTADRPPELRHRRAPQTIDQTDLFARHVRLALDLGALSDPDVPRAAFASAARVAVRAALGPPAGPVHLNASLRKPLEPPGELLDLRFDGPGDGPGIRPPRCEPDPEAVGALAPRLAAAQRPAIVAGPVPACRALPADRVRELAARIGAVALCEAGSGATLGDGAGFPLVDAFEPIVRCPSAGSGLMPDLVIQLGPPPVSKGLDAWFAAPGAPARIVVAAHGVPDPWHAAHLLAADPLAGLEALAEAAGGADRAAWLARWERAVRAADEARGRALEEVPGQAGLRESRALAAVLARLAPGRHVLLANSLPLREAELFAPPPRTALSVITQRGASGIDGLVAGAAGAALATGAPVLAVLGDVAALHDVGSLHVLRDRALPVVVAVIDNRGGRIFEQLPAASSGLAAGEFEAALVMPPRVDLIAAGAAFGIPALRAGDAAALRAALD
ncbi:MAG: 2-succinyl-5-enolpyruvyl-6-hydroxy-3-cyclohexene-1-carboxylic-acid synthase, partial [Acidobacteria bacterium]